ncbi:YecA family protein [Candidatus Sororendozoicomonas aggregata]|uniref:YecA/YgfB family protein n=1 Tax=Candidatus Sororendozoicomonas aggregata TaxID=3073239 RepID=UPI002ED5AFA5
MADLEQHFKDLIQQHAVGADPMPYLCAHGFMTAQAICASQNTQDDIIAVMLDGEARLSTEARADFTTLLTRLTHSIDRAFHEEETVGLPFSMNDQGHLADWCTGFMEAHFLAEKRWFEAHEQEVCELLLPIMLASGLFSDEPDFQPILSDEQLTEDMVEQIPDVLMELYLMFNSPEDIRKESKSIK